MSPQIPDFPFSMNRLDKAGKSFRKGTAEEEDYQLLNTWRVRCSAELSNVRTQVNGILSELEISPNALVSQRLKRLPTIISKLQHFPRMQLSTMQDIAGVRVVFGDGVALSRFLARIQREGTGFKVVRDYIKTPAESGYRGIHLVKTMNSKVKVELQIRTKIQHAWATTVEISDVLFKHEGEYKRDHTITSERGLFFQEVSKLMGMYERGETLDLDLVKRVLELDEKITMTKQVLEFGRVLGVAGHHLYTSVGEAYWLLEMREAGGISLSRSTESEKLALINQYTALEQEGKQAVLVKVDDFESLKKAYPNYLGDASVFTNFIKELQG